MSEGIVYNAYGFFLFHQSTIHFDYVYHFLLQYLLGLVSTPRLYPPGPPIRLKCLKEGDTGRGSKKGRVRV